MSTTTTDAGSCCCSGKATCTCSKCTGLECLERTRFFSGQLLTEAELNNEQAYHRAKQRLHNLHLHGWGVVCGLEVVCHDCEGWVTVQPGYAIDPCGEDVIVCQEHPLDVAQMIRDCKLARRRRQNCDRLKPAERPRDGVEHWCITLRYVEREAKPTTALRRESCQVCGCGPGCDCSCPCHGGKKSNGGVQSLGMNQSTRVRNGVGATVAPCEPTRIVETYSLEVCEAPEGYCDGLKSEAERAWKKKLEDCVAGLKKTFKRAPLADVGTLGDIQLESLNINSDLGHPRQSRTPAQLQQSFCQVRDFLYELLRNNPGNLHCSLVDKIRDLECPEPPPGASNDDFVAVLREPSRELLGYVALYVVDCLCWALLPPCAPCCPGDDELILACLDVVEDADGQIHIDHICNTSCRRYAGAFPPTIGGIHLGPIWPLVAKVLDLLCCGNLLDRFLSLARGSESGQAVARFLAEDNVARPRFVLEQVRRMKAADFVGATGPERLNLSTLVSKPVEDAVGIAKDADVAMSVQEVEAMPPLAFLRALPALKKGDHVIAYSQNGRVVGFALPGSTEAALVDQSVEIGTLRKDIEILRRSQ